MPLFSLDAARPAPAPLDPQQWSADATSLLRSCDQELILADQLLEDAPFGLTVIDAVSGTIVESNRAADRLLGLSPGSRASFCEMVAGDGSDLWRRLTQIEWYESTPFDFRSRAPADADYRIQGWASRVKVRGRSLIFCAFMRPAESGRLPGAEDLLAQVHALRSSEERARARTVELEAASVSLSLANRRKDEFLAQLSHEMRNPLAPIRMWTQRLLDSGETSPLVRQASQVLARQVRHLTRLVEDLLDVSRAVRDKLVLRDEPTSLTEAIELAAQMARPLIDERQHKLVVTLGCPPLWVRGDLARLGEVFHNLLDNSAKYTPPDGHIRLTVSQQPGEAVVTVEDDGIGIDADFMPRIFDMFARSPQAERLPTLGLGLGLSLVQQMVRAHGGTITARSRGAGLGSEFEVRLPLAQPPSETEGQPEPELTRQSRHRILVVDDERDVGEALALCLADHGHDLQLATDAAGALDLAERFRPHVVLMDIGLPGMDGHELARRLRATSWGSTCLLLALSGYESEQDRQRSRDAGCDDHLVKPVDPGALLARLAAHAPMGE